MLVVEGFEGPLDWLLEMARARKLDLRRLSILALVDCFGDAMQAGLPHGAPAMEMARWAGWTVLAAQLTELPLEAAAAGRPARREGSARAGREATPALARPGRDAGCGGLAGAAAAARAGRVCAFRRLQPSIPGSSVLLVQLYGAWALGLHMKGNPLKGLIFCLVSLSFAADPSRRFCPSGHTRP